MEEEWTEEKKELFGIKKTDLPMIEAANKPLILRKVTNDDVERKRAELEIVRLEKEIDKLDKPATNIDYFEKMLLLQNQHFAQLMEMQKQQFNLQLELEKLKLGGEEGQDNLLVFLDMLRPYLPQIVEAMKKKQDSNTPQPTTVQDSGTVASPENQVPEAAPTQTQEVDMTMEERVEAYKGRIRRGEVTEEEAYKDLCTELPQYAKLLSKKQFHEQYEKIKGGAA